jgi:hypothetical protein
LVVLLLVAAVVGHDLWKPADSWVLRYVVKQPPAAAPADELPLVPPEEPIAELEPAAPATKEKAAGTAAHPTLPAQKTAPAVEWPPPEAAGPAPAKPLATRPSAIPPGFAPPKLGTSVTVGLRTGAAMGGILRKVTDHSIDLEKGTVMLTLERAQMTLESRARFFAADYGEYLARREAAPAAEAVPDEPAVVAGGKPLPSAKDLKTRKISAPKPRETPATPVGSTTNVPAPTGEPREASDIFFDAFSK